MDAIRHDLPARPGSHGDGADTGDHGSGACSSPVGALPARGARVALGDDPGDDRWPDGLPGGGTLLLTP